MSNKIDFHFDFETRSRLDLKKVGAVKYAAHPSTSATLLTWGFGRTGKVKAWRIGQPVPQEIIDVLVYPEKYNFIAWNIEFDFMIWSIPFARQSGLTLTTRPKISDLTDAMALSQHFRTGASLASGAKMLNIPMSKDKEGRRIMLKQCKINKKINDFPELTKEEWTHFERYGIIDTVILREAYYKLPPLPAAERWAFEWTLKRNLTGIKIDMPLIKIMDEIVNHYMPQLEEEFFAITGVKVKSPKALGYFKPHFPWIENMQADTVRDMLLQTDGVDPVAVRALELKSLAGSTSISKVKCAVNMNHNDRVYGLFAYHMAQTKRFAGKGIQIHNFPRPGHGAKDQLPELNVYDLATPVRNSAATLQDPIGYVKDLLRRMWIPDVGKVLYCGDFSKVEPTVLYWLTGMGAVPKMIYEETASEIYNKPVIEIGKDSEERQIGKNTFLGGGYGMGWQKFIDQVAKQTGIKLTDSMAQLAIKTYRRINKPIVDFWRDIESAFRKAIYGEGTVLAGGKIHVFPMQAPWRGVIIRLPSGSQLYYHNAHIKVEMVKDEIVEIINNVPVTRTIQRAKENIKYHTDLGQGRIGDTTVYGGLLTEHVTSATARDLLTHAMYQLEQNNFEVLATVHDEIWGQAIAGRDKEFTETMCKLPYWCTDLIVTADGENGVRYLK